MAITVPCVLLYPISYIQNPSLLCYNQPMLLAKIKQSVLLLLLLTTSLFLTSPVLASHTGEEHDTAYCYSLYPQGPTDEASALCFNSANDLPTASGDFSPAGTDSLNTGNLNIEENPIYVRLIEIINVLSVGVGIVITISVVYSGIQYITSRGDPAQTQKAIARITSAGIALVLYVFGWTILNWLIPGGVLN